MLGAPQFNPCCKGGGSKDPCCEYVRTPLRTCHCGVLLNDIWVNESSNLRSAELQFVVSIP